MNGVAYTQQAWCFSSIILSIYIRDVMFHSTVLRFAPPVVSTNHARPLKTPTHVRCDTTVLLFGIYSRMHHSPRRKGNGRATCRGREAERRRNNLLAGGRRTGRWCFSPRLAPRLRPSSKTRFDFRLENNCYIDNCFSILGIAAG